MTARQALRAALGLFLVALVAWSLTGCVPAANLIDTQGLLAQMKAQQTAAQARESLCNASYRDVVAEMGGLAAEVCK